MRIFRLRKVMMLILLAGGAVAAVAQALPDNPAPAPIPDPAWSRLQNLTNGQPIVVTDNSGRSVHCLFAGVSDVYLFCNPPGNPAGVGFRFDHADIQSVDRDWPGYGTARARPPERNYHPAWIASMIAGGLVVGLIASQNTDAGKAAQDGFIGAAAVGLIGAPLAFLPHPQLAVARPTYPLFGIGVPLRRPTRLHSHISFGLRARP